MFCVTITQVSVVQFTRVSSLSFLTRFMALKRKHEDTMQQQSPFMPMFEGFRSELDEHHDRRERVIKASRDVTAASKKM